MMAETSHHRAGNVVQDTYAPDRSWNYRHDPLLEMPGGHVKPVRGASRS
jgi:hypothetical protein